MSNRPIPYSSDYYALLAKNRELSGDEATFFAHCQAGKIYALLFTQATPSTILDIGCGDGLLTSFIQALYPQAQVYGCDTNSESIEFARLAYPTITFDSMDTTLPYQDATFDVVIASHVLHHIAHDRHAWYVQEMNRVLKPGGTLIVLELNPYNPITAWQFKKNPLEKGLTMVSARYTAGLLRPLGVASTIFYGFFMNHLQWLQGQEHYLAWLFVGPLYACVVRKSINH